MPLLKNLFPSHHNGCSELLAAATPRQEPAVVSRLLVPTWTFFPGIIYDVLLQKAALWGEYEGECGVQ